MTLSTLKDTLSNAEHYYNIHNGGVSDVLYFEVHLPNLPVADCFATEAIGDGYKIGVSVLEGDDETRLTLSVYAAPGTVECINDIVAMAVAVKRLHNRYNMASADYA